LVFGSADNCWKGCSGAIVSAHTSLADSWAVVDDDGCFYLWLHFSKSIIIKLNVKYPDLKGGNCWGQKMIESWIVELKSIVVFFLENKAERWVQNLSGG
jgi:hypothetical protein